MQPVTVTMVGQALSVLTNPYLALAGVAAVGVPVAIHLLSRVRRQPMPWGAMRFVLASYRRQRRRVKLEQLLLLLLRGLLLFVLGLALSGPVIGGCAGRVAGPLSQPERLVYLVIDDSLSTRSVDRAGRSRFERLRAAAGRVLDGLGPSDRVRLWRAGRSVEHVTASGPMDPVAAGRVLGVMEPRFGRTDMAGVFRSIEGVLDEDQDLVDHRRAWLVILSDWSRDVLSGDGVASGLVSGLSGRVSLMVNRPLPAAANVQVTSITLGRQVVLAEPEGSDPRVVGEVRLRRFGGELPAATTGLEVSVLETGLESAINAVERVCRWHPGQRVLDVQLEVGLASEGRRLLRGGENTFRNHEVRLIRAHIPAPRGSQETDTIAADNQRWAVVGLRKSMYIGLVDGTSRRRGLAEGLMTPRRWLTLALNPRWEGEGVFEEGAGGWPFRLEVRDASMLDRAELRELDAAMVLRPDLLDDRGWSALDHLAARGGLVWLFIPPSEGASVWTADLADKLGVGWRVGVDPVGVDEGAGGSGGAGLMFGGPIPEVLGVLASEWEAMLRPVRVSRVLEVAERGLSGDGGSVWLRTTEGRAVLLSESVGKGRVVLLTTAIDPSWTNLATKPLFVPLLHEVLRGSLSDFGVYRRVNRWVFGDQASWGETWVGGEQLEWVPGSSSGAGEVITANPDATDGDTQTVGVDALSQWASGFDRWSWLNMEDPVGGLVAGSRGVDLGGALLWATLVLVIAESLLARRFSYIQPTGVERAVRG